ncbi:YqzL-like protein [Marininema mesophilum]|uniref:YqzL-like protein n=1 Tax=Marininema mesophilum TaxID=1048340 RepID=A0A1H2R3Y9_9BACL|nr:YqzL family protein [Marininema mesophilum]SDW14071.1 YqzL-like protein [Marininema mesophilum]
MRSFSWNCFEATGDIDAYLLFKDADMLMKQGEEENLRVTEEKVEV